MLGKVPQSFGTISWVAPLSSDLSAPNSGRTSCSDRTTTLSGFASLGRLIPCRSRRELLFWFPISGWLGDDTEPTACGRGKTGRVGSHGRLQGLNVNQERLA